MSEKEKSENSTERRNLLKTAAIAGCGLGLAAVLGIVWQNKSSNAQTTGGAQKGLIKSTRSKWFTALETGEIRCELCPKECLLKPGERGPCRVRENRNGEGYTLVYGNPALIQEDPIERKPFFHVLPGSRALSVSTAGCNLECKFCEVWDMALAEPEELFAYDMPPDSVVEHAMASGVRSVSYAFGEPVIFYEYMESITDYAKQAGLLNIMHTAGYIQPEPLNQIIGKLDAVNVDLKSFDPKFYNDVVGGKIEPVLETLKTLKNAGTHIEITNIVIPTLNDDMSMIRDMSAWIIEELGSGVPLHFARFYPLYKLSSLPRTPVSTLDQARDTAMDAGLKYVYVARVTGHVGENTFCGGCGEKIIDRIGFVVDSVKISNGKCDFCGETIPGIWA